MLIKLKSNLILQEKDVLMKLLELLAKVHEDLGSQLRDCYKKKYFL